MEELITNVLEQFNFAYCLIVNITTYIIIKIVDYFNKDKEVNKIIKRLILVLSILLIGGLYWLLNYDLIIIVNSSILAPVAWSWLFKPLCSKLGIDYNKINDTINN